MGKPEAPSPPDPKVTGAAQTATNVTTALANAQLGNVDQYTPNGSLLYSTDPSQTQTFTDPNTGATYDIPKYTATETLSPQQSKIKKYQDQASRRLSRLAFNQAGFLGDYMQEPFTGDNDKTEARLMELGRKRLDPLLARQDEDLRTRLANQGLKAGTDAYERELGLQNESRNDAYNQLLLSGNQQAFNQSLAARNQPINEITALMSGGQVSNPSFNQTNQPSLPTVDYAGLVNENYNQRLGIHNQKAAQRQNLLGGLFGLGAAAISDERAKKNKEKIGKIDGHNVYRYNYKGEPAGAPKSIGVMAQEAEKKAPNAVITGDDGIKRVKYGELFGAS